MRKLPASDPCQAEWQWTQITHEIAAKPLKNIKAYIIIGLSLLIDADRTAVG